MTVLLVALAVGFAWSMGAHYTGACMGMPHALRAVTAWQALTIMAPLTLLGAAFASHAVEHTVGHGLLTGAGLAVPDQVIVLAVAFALTTVFTRARVPTSTIQILVFSVAGVAVAAGAGVHWAGIGQLAGVWVAAPLAAAGLGYALTRLFDQVPGLRAEAAVDHAVTGATVPATAPPTTQPTPEPPTGPASTVVRTGALLGVGLVVVGAIASFAMGANDVANATGSLVGTDTFSPLGAGLLGGAGLALGVLTWGRPLLNKVAFDIVTVDRPMATAAQLIQGLVVLAAVSFGYFTSMNQALVGAMLGTGAARGRHSVHRASIEGILRGWLIGPSAGFALGYAITTAITAATGTHTLLAS